MKEKEVHKRKLQNFIFTAGIVILAALLFPVPGYLKDGGSKTVTALSGIYRVVCWNGMGAAEDEHTDGVTVTVFGIDIVDTFHVVK